MILVNEHRYSENFENFKKYLVTNEKCFDNKE